jgi:hypothetical protein
MNVNEPWSGVGAFLRSLRGCQHSRIINVADDNGPPRLVAVIPAASKQGETSDQASAVKYCRNALKKRFAADPHNKSSIPQRWVVLENFPLDPAGNVDEVAVNRELVKLGFAASGVSRIDKLRSIVAQVLRIQYGKVTPTSSFIRLGGSSISAIEVMSRSLKHNMILPVAAIMRSKSLAELADHAEPVAAPNGTSSAMRTYEADGQRVEMQIDGSLGVERAERRKGDRAELPCLAVQDGILISQLRSAEAYSITCVLQLTSPDQNSPLSIEKLEEAWCAVVARHDALRTTFVSSKGGESMFQQVISPSCRPEIKRLPLSQSDKTALEALHALRAPVFTLSSPGHFLTTCATESGQVFCRLDMNHAIVDGMSAVIILNDLGTAYRDSTLAPHGASLQDYIVSRLDRPQNTSLKYWLSYLDGFQPAPFPTLAEPCGQPHSFATLPLEIKSGNLKEFCKNHGVTIPVLLQCVWAMVLRAYLQTDDVSFGYLGSGRDMPIAGVERIVGVLINLLICRVRFEPTLDISMLLNRLQGELALALENQDTSLAKIQHGLQLGETPLFDTLLSVMYWGTDEPQDTRQVDVKVLSHTAKTEVSRHSVLNRHSRSMLTLR